MSLLEARAVVHSYPGGVRALDGLDLRIERGRRLAILGPNGSGKTTALLHLNGILKPQSGSVLLDGRPMQYDPASLTDWRRRVGLVLQNADDQLFAATVAEDVSFGPLNLGLAAAQVQERVQYALEALHVAALAERATHMLSFGQKKRVAIAGLVAMRPEILLLDEPTAGLDHQGTEDLLAVLAELERSSGATLVLSTHDVDLAYCFADEVALFEGGRALCQGSVTQTLMDPLLLQQAGLAMPFLLKLGLRARETGILGGEAPLPRTEEEALALLMPRPAIRAGG